MNNVYSNAENNSRKDHGDTFDKFQKAFFSNPLTVSVSLRSAKQYGVPGIHSIENGHRLYPGDVFFGIVSNER